jgi:hypothetical protein
MWAQSSRNEVDLGDAEPSLVRRSGTEGGLWDTFRPLAPLSGRASLMAWVATCMPVAIDVQALLRKVVAEVFDADVTATYSTHPKNPHTHRVRLTPADGRRKAGLEASHEWFQATIFDLGVSTHLLDYDDEVQDKEAILRALALVVRAYLRGEGRVERRRGLIRSHPVLRVVVDNREWELGHRSSQPHYLD